MTPRRKYDLATAGWCVVAAVIVYLVLAFISMDWVGPVRNPVSRGVLVWMVTVAILVVGVARADKLPHY